MKRRRKWPRYLTPGLVFQSVLIGGGYGTGAEIARYFGCHGLMGGLLALGAAAAGWAALCAVTFEFVRVFRTYDYGSMMKRLLAGPGSSTISASTPCFSWFWGWSTPPPPP